MRKRTILLLGTAVCLYVLSSCAPVKERVVSLWYVPPRAGERQLVGKVRVTVNDFRDVREAKEIVGVDYTNAADIKLKDPVPVAVTGVVVDVLKMKGFSPLQVKEGGKVSDYIDEYEADFHLQGEVEELFVTVKRSGVLALFSARCRIFFRLFGREGQLLWSGRYSSKREVEAPFVSDKAIEEALSDCVSEVVVGFLGDPSVMQVTGQKKEL